ncbi:MAG: methylmalonyl Co-A mutase-associated GTPase MeaB [Sulfolobaceae archaeon]
MYNELLSRALNGDIIAIGKILTHIENLTEYGVEFFKYLSKRAGNSHVIGITGLPGAGKSTLISRLIEEYVKEGYRVGVVLVEPSSPFSSGSFMGNRIRMQDKSILENVFIRSVASRGNLGGISAEALMLIEALDGLGYDKIIIETVGAGQTDTEVNDVTHTVIVVTVPGTGDEIQVMKAGIMEIGDIYVVNKADKPEAEALFSFILNYINLDELMEYTNRWRPRVLKVSSLRGDGINELINIINDHFKYISSNGLFSKKIENRRIKILELYLDKKFKNEVKKILQNSEVARRFVNGEIEVNRAIAELWRALLSSSH